ncbi:unnamed protein product [Ophioblennius macclurei]
MVQTCCVSKCLSRSRDRMGKKNTWLRFFSFPAWKQGQGPRVSELSKARRMAWISAVRRSNISFSSSTRNKFVCSRHFRTGRPAYEMDQGNTDWAPTLHLGHTETKAADNMRYQRRIGGWNRVTTVNSAVPATPAPDAKEGGDTQTSWQMPIEDEEEATQTALQVPDVNKGIAENKQCVRKKSMDGATNSMHVEMNRLLEENLTLKKELRATEMNEGFFSEDSEKAKDEKVKCYTGLPYWTLLRALHTVIRPCLTTAEGDLSPFQMLLLTLMRLRLHLPQQHLADLFRTSRVTVSDVFRETVDALHFHLAPLVRWPARHSLRHTMPHKFVETFGGRVAVILDFFEISTLKPPHVNIQEKTYPHSKKKHIFKYMIGITPQGSISFVSKGFEGRVSNKHLIEQCGILNKLLPGDMVLADRGYNVGDEVGLMCAEVKSPRTSGGDAQMDPKSVEETRQITHLRVHVERVIGLVRNKYKILQQNIPVSLKAPLKGEEFCFMDKIVTVCCALTNMSPGVVVT